MSKTWEIGNTFSLLAGFLITGCALGQPSVRPPAAPLPMLGQYSFATTSIEPNVSEYWRVLEDRLLSDFVQQAIEANAEIEQAAARVAQARAALRGAQAGYLPNVSGAAGVSRDIGNFANDTFNPTLGADVNWQVDLFGRISGAVAASHAELLAAGYSLADVQRLIVGAVAQTTIRARSAAVQLTIARDTLANQDENLQITIWRRQAGLVSSLDVEQARVQRAQTAALIPQLESDLTANANAISTLTGQMPGRVRALLQPEQASAIPEPPIRTGLGAPAQLLRRRPDIRAAELRLISDSARIDVARAHLLPLLTLRGNIGTGGVGFGSLFDLVSGNLFGGLSQLIFDGGRTRANIDSAKAAARFSLASWRLAVLRALEEVETAAIDLDKSRDRVALLEDARKAADNAALLARSQYQAGLVDFQTLLTVENQLLSTRNALANAEAARAISFVRLTQGLGGGWTEDEVAQVVSRSVIRPTVDESASE